MPDIYHRFYPQTANGVRLILSHVLPVKLQISNNFSRGESQIRMISGCSRSYDKIQPTICRLPFLVTWGSFFESPQTLRFRPFSGVTILSLSYERRDFKPSNFTNHFAFRCPENMSKEQLVKTSEWQFRKWLSGPEKFS